MEQLKKVAFHTLGCKLNFSETSTIARKFEKDGYLKVPFDSPADIYVINTCSVTDNADKECKKIVRSALKQQPDAFVIVTGCYAQLKPDEISNIEGVDLVLGAGEKFKITEYLADLTKKEQGVVHSCEIENVNSFVDSFSTGDRTRTFLKVQDGCDYTCSYCTIPLARGISRSDSLENIVNNVRKIADQGIKEIVLTGVNVGDFGKGEFGNKRHEHTFLDLVRTLENVDGIERFRISSIEPNLLKDDVIEFVATSRKFVPHFHIPLQSGSDRILKLMRRRYLTNLYSEKIRKIKELIPHCCIGVDVITGFPSESDSDFNDTYKFLSDLDISYLHVFTYSERPNTDAIKIEPAVPMDIRKKRNKMLTILSTKKRRGFYEAHLNSVRTALFEQENKNDFIYGFTDNYIKVKTHYNNNLINKLQQVELVGIDKEGNVEVKLI